MPYPEPAPAAPGNQAPLPVVPPSLRRPPPANLPRTPRPISGHRRFSTLVRKLHSWELEHLRAHCAELQAENERLLQDLHYADDRAEMWQHDVERMQDEGATIGLAQDGGLHLLAEPSNVLQPLPPSRPMRAYDAFGQHEIGSAYQAPGWTRLSRRVASGFPAHWWVTEHRWDQADREWMRSYPAVVNDFGDIVEVVA